MSLSLTHTERCSKCADMVTAAKEEEKKEEDEEEKRMGGTGQQPQDQNYMD